MKEAAESLEVDEQAWAGSGSGKGLLFTVGSSYHTKTRGIKFQSLYLSLRYHALKVSLASTQCLPKDSPILKQLD